LPNIRKTADTQLDFRVVTEGFEIGAGWTGKGDTSNKEYVNLSIAMPESGLPELYTSLGQLVGSEAKDFLRSDLELANQTKAPAQVLHGGNHI
jgi:uncharacterized protein (DUF736 family)